MGGSKPKKVAIPPAAPISPVPSPVPVDVEVLEKDRARRAQKMRKFGRAGTILTGLGSSDASESKRGTLLGGSV